MTTHWSDGTTAGDRFVLRTEPRGGSTPRRWARGVQGWAAGLLEGWVPFPASADVVVVEPGAGGREVLRIPVGADTFDPVVTALTADLDRLTPEELVREWGAGPGGAAPSR